MRHCDCPPKIPEPRALPPARRRALNAAKFWMLMDRWKVSTAGALKLIGMAGGTSADRRPNFSLSDRQAEVLSCLLEIDLTLTLTALAGGKHGRRRACQTLP